MEATQIDTAKRAVKFGLAGALIGAVAGWLIFGGTSYNAATGNYGWGPVMAPVFALIGAILGVLNSFLVSALRVTKKRAASKDRAPGPDSPIQSEQDDVNTAEWDNPENWAAGIFYHSALDTRTIVPKRIAGFGYTINLGHPAGVVVAIALLVLIVGTVIYGARGR